MWPTILIASAVAAAFIAVVVKGVINKKSGKHSCSCGGSCGTCGMNCQRARENQ